MSERELQLIYEQNKDSSSGFILPLVFILSVLSSFGYLYSKIQRKLMHISWSEQKCNPRYLFFSGFLDPLNKNPFQTTQDNFEKCVATNVYKDPAQLRVIKKNQERMIQHQNEMKNNLETATKYANALNQGWTSDQDGIEQSIMDVNTENNAIFDHHEVLYREILLKSTQMFNVLSSIIRYFQGILVYQVSNYKLGFTIDDHQGIDEIHAYFMSQYDSLYTTGYSAAYQKLSDSTTDYHDAINTARNTIEQYDALSQVLDNFMYIHLNDIQSITESCYHLKYNMDDQTCPTIFPNINMNYVDFYPTLANALQG